MISCEELFHFLDEFLEGNLSYEMASNINHHMGQCKECEIYLKTYKRTVSLLKKTPSEPMPEELKSILISFYHQANDGNEYHES